MVFSVSRLFDSGIVRRQRTRFAITIEPGGALSTSEAERGRLVVEAGHVVVARVLHQTRVVVAAYFAVTGVAWRTLTAVEAFSSAVVDGLVACHFSAVSPVVKAWFPMALAKVHTSDVPNSSWTARQMG